VFAAPKTTPIATPAAMTTIAVIITRSFCSEEGDSGGENRRFEIGTAAFGWLAFALGTMWLDGHKHGAQGEKVAMG
jgi:hypothetical protein